MDCERLIGKLSSNKEVLSGTLSLVKPISGEEYDGEYIISPNTKDDTILDTKDKIMENDVTVLKISCVKTHNSSNGLTVIIG